MLRERFPGGCPLPHNRQKVMTIRFVEDIYSDFLFDCYLANQRLTDEEWEFYGKEEHHIEIPSRDGGVLNPLNSQFLTTYQHWIAGALQSEVIGKKCFAMVPKGVLSGMFEMLRDKWQRAPEESRSMAGKIGGTTTYERSAGFFAWDREKRLTTNSEAGKIGGKAGLNADPNYLRERGKKAGNKVGNTRAICLVTGFESNISGLTRYQRARGIDTKLRRIL
jgi:general stress protein YciG